MFLFLPLGWFDLRTALVLWYALHCAMLALDALLLWRVFFPRGDAVELAACAALLCAAPGTLLTFHYAQTTLVALAVLLLAWRPGDAGSRGAWAAVAFLVKPFLGVLAACLALRGRWRALVGFIALVAALTLASVATFGPRTCVDYISGTARSEKPAWIYRESTNQSLLGWMLRATGTRCRGTECVTQPMFVAAATVLAALTVFWGLRLARRSEEWMVALYLLLALLVYPVSQSFYSVLLIPPLLLAWRERERICGRAWTVALVSALIYALCAWDNGSKRKPRASR